MTAQGGLCAPSGILTAPPVPAGLRSQPGEGEAVSLAGDKGTDGSTRPC